MTDRTIPKDGANTFVNRRYIANRWTCSTETIKRRERAGILKAYKLGSQIRYLLADVERIEKEAATA